MVLYVQIMTRLPLVAVLTCAVCQQGQSHVQNEIIKEGKSVWGVILGAQVVRNRIPLVFDPWNTRNSWEPVTSERVSWMVETHLFSASFGAFSSDIRGMGPFIQNVIASI